MNSRLWKIKSVRLFNILWQTIVPFFILLPLYGCHEQEEYQTTPAEVVYSVVETETVALTSDLPGRVSALVVAEVRPQVDGIIQQRLFEEGSEVEQGQVLYQIDPAMYQAHCNTARAELEEAEANVVAVRQLELRYRKLVQTKAISMQDLDNAVAAHRQARARVARAKAELDKAAINLAYTQIKAPVSGKIGRSSVTRGTLVTANQTEALAIIRQTDQVYVDITQPSVDLLNLRRSMSQNATATNRPAKVVLTLEDGKPYAHTSSGTNSAPEWIQGDLLFSEISVGQSTGSVNIRALFPNPEGLLLPGMYVKATIEEGTLDNAVLVPQGTVLADESGGHYALVLKKNTLGAAQAGDNATAQTDQQNHEHSTGQKNGHPTEDPPTQSAEQASELIPPPVSETANGQQLYQAVKKPVRLDRSMGNRWVISSGLERGDLLIVEGLQKALPGDIVSATRATSHE